MRPIRSANRKGPDKAKIGLGRWRLVVAIVFLFSFALIGKLFALQVKDSSIYKAKASNQHEYSSQLMPIRGKIYFSEKSDGGNNLYAAAAIRDLATIYSIPMDVKDPLELAEKFYLFFDKPLLEKEKKESLEKEGKSIKAEDLLIATSTKEQIVSDYLKRFDKPGDPYEPLNKVLDVNQLLDLYTFLINSDYNNGKEMVRGSLRDLASSSFLASDLIFQNEKIYLKVDEDKKLVSIPGLNFSLSKHRYYPEGEVASQILGYVGYNNEEGHGRYGLEEFFDTELFGEFGYLKSEKANSNKLIIVNDREYVAPKNGSDLVLTIDRNIEFFACEALKKSVEKHNATGGSVIVIEPKTGAILAMCSEPSFDPNKYQEVDDISYFNNPASFYQYEPGSVFKVITMAAAINENKVSPSTTYEDKGEIMISGWNKPIRNSDFSTKGAHGLVDMNYVLDNSLNTGAIFAMRQIGDKTFADYVQKFGFGEITGVELGSESSGNINNLLRNNIKEIDAATASFGQGIAVTPLQMVMSYQAIANNGVLMKPYVVKKIITDGQEEITKPKKMREVISQETADTILAMLVNIVEKGHSKKAHIDGYYLGGKTGTAQIATVGGYKQDEYIHTFIGVAPIDEPEFVMLTKIDSPKDVQYAEGSAVPLWRDIAEFILRYYQTPKTRK